jgi:hypothetical protein
MTLRGLHRIHRWIAIATGLFIVGWILTGVVPMVPAPGPGPRPPQALDLGQVAVTPAEAARALGGTVPAVTSLRLTQLGDVLAYEIALAGRGPRLVDARTGRPLTIDSELARSIATARAPAGARIAGADVLSRRRHDLTYLWGSLPAHRVTFDDPSATVVYVGAEDGTVWATTRWTRIRGAIGAFHTFDPLDLVLGEPKVRKAILVAVSLVALLTALTGYAIVAWRRGV